MRKRLKRLKNKLAWSAVQLLIEAPGLWKSISVWLKWLAAGLAVVGVLWLVPKWQATGVPSSRITTANLENEFRKTIAQIVGGGFALVALYFTWRRVRIAEQGHITDRFTAAIEQLGKSDDAGKPILEIRLGAIYALERIAWDSARDRWTIIEVLTAYVRENAPALKEAAESEAADDKPEPAASKLRTDIQAALTVIGRRKITPQREAEQQMLDLSFTDLRGVKLAKAQLLKGDFTGAQLQAAELWEAQLQGANFHKAQLQGAVFAKAQLEDASFFEAQLQGAEFLGAQLQGADFIAAQLQGTNLSFTNLRRANFSAARLQETNFSNAQLQGVKGITPERIKEAKGWETAIYNRDLALRLGLNPNQTGEEERQA